MPAAQAPYTFKPGDFFRSLGFVLCLVTAGLTAFFFTAPHRQNSGNDLGAYLTLGFCWAIGILCLLSRGQVDIWPKEGRYRSLRGIWPIVRSSEGTLDYAERIQIVTFRTRGGSQGYRGTLYYSDGRKLKLVRSLDIKERVQLGRLAQEMRLPLSVPQSMSEQTRQRIEATLGFAPQFAE